jgi:antitoxin CptB
MDQRQQKIAKLQWRCRRGMLELDLILTRFLDGRVKALSDEQLTVFEALLDCPDPDLFAWFMAEEEPTEQEFIELVQLIRAKN